MRYSLLALITLLLISGCAHKQRVQAKLDVPARCIMGGVVDKAKCEAFKEGEMVCDKVVVKFACVEVKK